MRVAADVSAPTSIAGIAPPAWRLPAQVRLGGVVLQIADLARSLEYYTTVLGLRVLEQTSDRATLGAHGSSDPLVELRAGAEAASSPQHKRLGLYHFAILLPDRASLGSFIEHLGRIGARAGASDHLVSEALYLRDPDGLGIEVYADRPRATWAVSGHELRMDTTPLDLAAVVRAAGGAPFTGMPDGTCIGHVHLHVGDLAEGERFFHRALGLDKMVWSYPGALFLAAGGYHHHLGINTWAGADALPPREEDTRLVEWRIVLPTAHDVASTVASVASSGYAANANDANADVSAKAPLLTDPWGTSIRLVAA